MTVKRYEWHDCPPGEYVASADYDALAARLAEALWLVENGTPHDRMLAAGRWDEWLNRRNEILGWADDSGRPADTATGR